MQVWFERNAEYLNRIDRDIILPAMEKAPEIIALLTEMGIAWKSFMEAGRGADPSEKALKNAFTPRLADAEVCLKGGDHLPGALW